MAKEKLYAKLLELLCIDCCEEYNNGTKELLKHIFNFFDEATLKEFTEFVKDEYEQ